MSTPMAPPGSLPAPPTPNFHSPPPALCSEERRSRNRDSTPRPIVSMLVAWLAQGST